jgi:hypothetical protein
MKKLSILFASLLVAAMVVTSCSKEAEKSEGLNELGKATITGKVYMNYTDNTNNPGSVDLLEMAPAGTQVIATIDADDLAQDATIAATTAKKTYYTTVNADGEYTFSIHAGAKPVNVTIEFVDVMQARTFYADPDGDGTFSPFTENNTMWSVTGANNNFNVTVVEKQHKLRDFVYDLHWFVQDN